MAVFKSTLDVDSAPFQTNVAHMQALVTQLKAHVATVSLGGDTTAREKHLARGKLLVRDRVHTLLDPGTPFLEIGQLAAWGMYEIGRAHV